MRLSFSPTALADYAVCPRRFYYRAVVRAPKHRTGAAMRGVALHAALERAHLEGLAPEAAREVLRAGWDAALFASPEHEEAERARAEAALARELAAPAEPGVVPIRFEARLKGRIGRFPLVGVVDRLDRLPDGRVRLVDYKSGDPRGVRLDDPDDPLVRQLAAYEHLLAQAGFERRARPALRWLMTGETSEPDAAALAAAWPRLEALAEAAAADETFAACVGPACARCDYAFRCWPAQEAARGSEP